MHKFRDIEKECHVLLFIDINIVLKDLTQTSRVSAGGDIVTTSSLKTPVTYKEQLYT